MGDLYSDQLDLTLWGRNSSINVQKVLWMLAEANIEGYSFIAASAMLGPDTPYDTRIDPASKPYGFVDSPEYLRMNPTGLIPTLKIGDTVLWESNTIVRYLAARFTPDLCGSEGTLEGLARASMWMDWLQAAKDLQRGLEDLTTQAVRTPLGKGDIVCARSAYSQIIRALAIPEAQLGKVPYLSGLHFTVADIAFGPIVNRLLHCQQSATVRGWDLGEIGLPNIQDWYSRLQQRPAFVGAVIEPEREQHVWIAMAADFRDLKKPRRSFIGRFAKRICCPCSPEY